MEMMLDKISPGDCGTRKASDSLDTERLDRDDSKKCIERGQRRHRPGAAGAVSTTEDAAVPDFVPASRAIELLGVKSQTLYAYVARGWIRAMSQQGTHHKLYSREDVERVRSRSVARSGHGPVAAGALRWGEPVISSSITEITPEGPRYRSMLATELARLGGTFESVADLLWTGIWSENQSGWDVDPPPTAFYDIANDIASRFPTMRYRNFFATLVQLLSAAQNGDADTETGAVLRAGRQIIRVLAGAFAFLRNEPLIVPLSGEPVAHLLARALHLSIERRRLLDAMLILCADHELATATFAARVTASAGARVNACVLAGIAAFEGPLTWDDVDWADELVRNPATRTTLLEQFALAREKGSPIPGYNHPLYPQGDPRARCLIDAVAQMADPAPAGLALIEFVDECERRWRIQPSLPVALVAGQLALDLPPQTGGALFLLARVAGYVAHAQEQYRAGFLVRPRAKFTP